MFVIIIACYSIKIIMKKRNVTFVVPIDMRKAETKFHAKFCVIFLSQIGCKGCMHTRILQS